MQAQPVSRIGLLGLSLVCLIFATAIIFRTGLPERADYTGFQVAGGVAAPEPDHLAPPLELPALDGSTVSLEALRGKPVIINFWATWCEPCRVEMPELQSLAEQHGPTLHIIGVNLGEPAGAVAAWRDQYALTFPLALDNGSAAASYYLRGQPSTFVVDPDGVIRNIHYGPTTAASLNAALAPYLSNEGPPLS